MATYAQLQAEPWWGREIVTPELDWLADELCRRTGQPRTAAGTKGNEVHLRGAHRSQEWIQKSRYCTSRTYTVQSGLTAEQARYVAGLDFTPASADEMVAQCKRLMAAVKSGELEEVREFYGNVDGNQVVDGWDNVRDRAASSDSSHLWHWHLTFDRRHCADRALMERIFAIALGEDDDMFESSDRKMLTAVNERLLGLVKLQPAVTSSWSTQDPKGKDQLTVVPLLTEIKANMAVLAGRDWVDEQQIVDGVLAGLGTKDLGEVVDALRAALGDERAVELGGLLLAARQGS